MLPAPGIFFRQPLRSAQLVGRTSSQLRNSRAQYPITSPCRRSICYKKRTFLGEPSTGNTSHLASGYRNQTAVGRQRCVSVSANLLCNFSSSSKACISAAQEQAGILNGGDIQITPESLLLGVLAVGGDKKHEEMGVSSPGTDDYCRMIAAVFKEAASSLEEVRASLRGPHQKANTPSQDVDQASTSAIGKNSDLLSKAAEDILWEACRNSVIEGWDAVLPRHIIKALIFPPEGVQTPVSTALEGLVNTPGALMYKVSNHIIRENMLAKCQRIGVTSYCGFLDYTFEESGLYTIKFKLWTVPFTSFIGLGHKKLISEEFSPSKSVCFYDAEGMIHLQGQPTKPVAKTWQNGDYITLRIYSPEKKVSFYHNDVLMAAGVVNSLEGLIPIYDLYYARLIDFSRDQVDQNKVPDSSDTSASWHLLRHIPFDSIRNMSTQNLGQLVSSFVDFRYSPPPALATQIKLNIHNTYRLKKMELDSLTWSILVLCQQLGIKLGGPRDSDYSLYSILGYSDYHELKGQHQIDLECISWHDDEDYQEHPTGSHLVSSGNKPDTSSSWQSCKKYCSLLKSFTEEDVQKNDVKELLGGLEDRFQKVGFGPDEAFTCITALQKLKYDPGPRWMTGYMEQLSALGPLMTKERLKEVLSALADLSPDKFDKLISKDLHHDSSTSVTDASEGSQSFEDLTKSVITDELMSGSCDANRLSLWINSFMRISAKDISGQAAMLGLSPPPINGSCQSSDAIRTSTPHQDIDGTSAFALALVQRYRELHNIKLVLDGKVLEVNHSSPEALVTCMLSWVQASSSMTGIETGASVVNAPALFAASLSLPSGNVLSAGQALILAWGCAYLHLCPPQNWVASMWRVVHPDLGQLQNCDRLLGLWSFGTLQKNLSANTITQMTQSLPNVLFDTFDVAAAAWILVQSREGTLGAVNSDFIAESWMSWAETNLRAQLDGHLSSPIKSEVEGAVKESGDLVKQGEPTDPPSWAYKAATAGLACLKQLDKK